VSLFTQRLAADQEAAARCRGENIDGLTDEAPAEFRQQLVYAINRVTTWPIGEGWRVRNMHRYLIGEIRQLLREEYGVGCLAAATEDPGEDLSIFILNVATTHQVMDVIDAVIQVFADQTIDPGLQNCAVEAASGFADSVSRRMKQHRLAYDLVKFKVVEKRSEELHAEVVAPALTLLHGRSRFADAERQYRDAIDELAGGKWADAITDASSAVENVLRVILGLSQGTLADLLGQARIRGLFGDPQAARLKKVVAGFTALADMRNEESDAHGNRRLSRVPLNFGGGPR
jgi:AbiJ N-terminal domain 4